MMTYDVDIVDLVAQPVAVVRGRATERDLPAFLARAFSEVLAVCDEQRISPAGPPIGRYRQVGAVFEVVAGFPTSTRVRAAGRVEAETLPGGPTARVLHVGDYSEVGSAYTAATDWLLDHGYVVSGDPWESYLDGATATEPRTVVLVPCTRP